MSCPICNSSSTNSIGEKNGFNLDCCSQCGLFFANPMPTDDVIDAFYQNYVTAIKYKKKVFKKTLTALVKIMRASFYKRTTTKSFLDVGCNIGSVVRAAKILGYQATGIDLDVGAIQTAKEKDPSSEYVAQGPESFSKTGNTYDLVFCMEVLEHTPNVREFAKSLRKLTKKGGVLYLTTPDSGHWKVPGDFPSWKEVRPPEHIVWFNKSNIRELFEASGFEIIKIMKYHRANIRLLARAM